MKKQELIHLHGLLAEVSEHCRNRGARPDLSEYDDLGVRPTSIHKSKTDHKRAVFALTNGITETVSEEGTETVSPRAD